MQVVAPQPSSDGRDPKDVIAALVNVMTFCLSMVCPDCRKEIVRGLGQHLPRMLDEANGFAAFCEDSEQKNTCH
jgi:hypothetical protein